MDSPRGARPDGIGPVPIRAPRDAHRPPLSAGASPSPARGPRPGGRRHPLRSPLPRGRRPIRADRGPGFNAAIGFTRRKTPCKATLSNLLRRLDVEALERALAAWVASRLGPDGAREIALDGKTLRGSADGPLPGVHLLAAYAPDVGAVLLQLRVDAKTNEHKAALAMLGVLPLTGSVVTADAMFTHSDFASEVLDAGGDYLLPVKDNRPRLLADVALAFETPEALSPPTAPSPGGRPAYGPLLG